MGLMGRRHVTPAGTTGYTTEKAGSRKPPRHAHPLPGVKGGNWCTKSFPIFADLAEDYVHDRWIVALGFLLIFTIVRTVLRMPVLNVSSGCYNIHSRGPVSRTRQPQGLRYEE